MKQMEEGHRVKGGGVWSTVQGAQRKMAEGLWAVQRSRASRLGYHDAGRDWLRCARGEVARGKCSGAAAGVWGGDGPGPGPGCGWRRGENLTEGRRLGGKILIQDTVGAEGREARGDVLS